MTTALNGIAPLPHLGVIRVEGEDATRFLQGQLTQDFALLPDTEARLAAFCSAKGRMQASFVGFRRGPHEILLVCSRDLLAPTLKRLSMFVLRAKARLSDASEQFRLLGVAGTALTAMVGHDSPPWRLSTVGEATLVSLHPSEGQPRALWVGPSTAAAPAGEAMDADLWRWSDVRSGVATLSAPVVDAFVPQMLNFESVGGVSFKKGCYPGQEVVARMDTYGNVRRHLVGLLIQDQTVPAHGSKLFSGDREVGWISSAVLSPQRHAVLAFGFPLRDFSAPNTELTVEVAGTRHQATVHTLPFYQRP